MHAAKGAIRAMKKMHRVYESHGLNQRTASRKAQDSVLSHNNRPTPGDDDYLPTPKHNKRRKIESEISPQARVYPGGRKTGKVRVSGISKGKLNKLRRSGRGKHAFKGKSKHKRR